MNLTKKRTEDDTVVEPAPKRVKEPKAKKEKAPKEPKVKKADQPLWDSPVKPSALLVPRYIREERALAKTRRVAVIAVGAVVLAVTAATAGAFLLSVSAKADLADAEAQRDTRSAEVAKLAGIDNLYSGLDQRRSAIGEKLVTDIAFDQIYAGINRALPAGVTIGGSSATPGEPCPGPNPFETAAALGCITLEGTARNAVSVGQFIENLNTSGALLGGAIATSIQTAENVVTFRATVNYSPEAYSNRYAGLININADEQQPDPAAEGN